MLEKLTGRKQLANVNKTASDYWKTDGLVENEIDRIIIDIGVESGDESEGENEDDNLEGSETETATEDDSS